MRRLHFGAIAILAMLLFSCTSFRNYQQAQQYELLDDWDNAVVEYSKALELDPGNMRYRMALQNAKLEASRVHFEKGKTLRAAGQNELAAMEFELTVKLDPTNQYAAVELAKAVDDLKKKNQESSEDSIEEMKRHATEKSRPPTLNPSSNQPISLSFPKETNVKDIYRALGNAFGINIMFDQRVKDDKISIELRDVTAQQALERVMQAAGHFYKVLDDKTIIVVPDTAQTRREYEDLVIRTFYLSNGDAEQVTNVVRTMIEARNVFPLKALNAITIRDTADKVLIAQKIIEANDKARAEVVVSVELLQADADKTRKLGMAINTGDNSGVPLSVSNAEGNAVQTIEALRNLNSSNFSFTLPTASYSLFKSDTEATLLAKPQLRISEGEKATLHIGQRVPVPVTTFNTAGSNTGQVYTPATSYNYQDIGIKISIEPRVHHNREVTLKLTVEVSSLQGYVPDTQQPIIGTRTIESTIRLKDGETNFLAGLIRRDDTSGAQETPFLSDIPILGRLFTNENKNHKATDLILTMTPHIIRVPDITEEDLAPMWVGTSNNMTFRGSSPRVESLTNGDPFTTETPAPENQQFQHATPAGAWQQPTPPPDDQQEAPRQPSIEQPPVMQPGAPTDPFRNPPKDNSGNGNGTRLQQSSSATAGADSDPYLMNLAPRIAPQPTNLAVAPGAPSVWKLVGMDLAGLTTPKIVLHYNHISLDLADVVLGEAIEVDPTSPPAVTIDRGADTVTVESTDGKPLRFRSGGDVLALRLHGGMTGESFLVIDDMPLRNSSGEQVKAAIAGGRLRVE